MEKIQRIYLALLFFLPESVFADFSGIWAVTFENQSTVTRVADEFNISIMQQGKNICGFHYGTARGKAKIDRGWAYEDRPTIYGTKISNQSANITLISAHNERPIRAAITISNGTLIWKVREVDVITEPTIPEFAILNKILTRDAQMRELKNCTENGT
jgi:hypothetical protein